jgi:hypothetical protein
MIQDVSLLQIVECQGFDQVKFSDPVQPGIDLLEFLLRCLLVLVDSVVQDVRFVLDLVLHPAFSESLQPACYLD